MYLVDCRCYLLCGSPCHRAHCYSKLLYLNHPTAMFYGEIAFVHFIFILFFSVLVQAANGNARRKRALNIEMNDDVTCTTPTIVLLEQTHLNGIIRHIDKRNVLCVLWLCRQNVVTDAMEQNHL